MSDLVKKIKIKKQDGTFTDYIPIGAEAQNVDVDGESVTYKLNKKPYYYNSVADMKADTKLKAGDMAITLGYYEINDGGGANYYITNVKNIKKYQEEIGTLFAELIVDKEINPLQIGMHNNGIDNNSDIFKKLIDIAIVNNLKLNFTNGTYFFNNKVIINNKDYKDKNLNINFNNVKLICDSSIDNLIEIHYLNNLDIKNLNISSNYNSNDYSKTGFLHLYWINKANISNIYLNNMYYLISVDYLENLETDFLINNLIIDNIKCIDTPLIGFLNNVNNSYLSNLFMDIGEKNIKPRELIYIRSNTKNLYASDITINNLLRWVLHCNRRNDNGDYSPAIGTNTSDNINLSNLNIMYSNENAYTYLLHFDSDDDNITVNNVKMYNATGLVGVTSSAKVKNIKFDNIKMYGTNIVKKVFDLANLTNEIDNLDVNNLEINQLIDINSINGLVNNFNFNNVRFINTCSGEKVLFFYTDKVKNINIDNVFFTTELDNSIKQQFMQFSNFNTRAIIKNINIKASNLGIYNCIIMTGNGNSHLNISNFDVVCKDSTNLITNNQSEATYVQYNNYINNKLVV